MSRKIKALIGRFPTSAFSLVMATGIISIAAELLEFRVISRTLFALNVVFFVLLSVQLLSRIALFRRDVLSDLQDHQRGFGFFTIVAGTAVLGNQFVLLASAPLAGLVLWIIAVTLWVVLTNAIFTSLIVKSEKPTLADGIHGGWLVSVVAAQSVSVLSSLLAARFAEFSHHLLFFALVVWLGGWMLYVWIISLIFYRYTFFPMSADHLTPPYWINMGAMAISTLAGAFLVGSAGNFRLLGELLPFLKGITLLCWATASWWIPILISLGFWRHILRRVPLSYDPIYWSMVFPLGMYSAATFRMATAFGLPALLTIPKFFFAAALACWLLTFFGLLLRIRRVLSSLSTGDLVDEQPNRSLPARD